MKIKFSDHKYAQAHMEVIPNGLLLVSYTTPVAKLQDNWLTVYELHSQTTRRHIGWFMREIGNFSYQLAKQLVEDNKSFNIVTGEVKDND